MLEKFRKGKDDKNTNEKATDRLAYMEGSVPAWQTASTNVQRSRGYSALMQRFNGWVYAAAMTNARGVASQTIKLYSARPKNGSKSIVATRPIDSRKSAYLRGQTESKPSTFVQRKSMHEDIVEVFNHPILDLLDSPSPEMDGYTLTMQRMLNLQLTGNAYLHPIISEAIGTPIELWNMQSDLVSIVPDGTMDLVDSYTYGRLPNAVEFRKDEVLHERQPNPLDPFYGMGWVAAAIDAVDLLNSMDDYEQNVLDNQARPDWAIMVKEHLTDNQYQRLMQQVERQLGGKNNRSRPFIFEGGTDGKPMQFSPQDLAFDSGETRKIEVIAAISGVPVSKLKANDPNLANAREGNLGWLRDTIVPYLSLDEGFLNRQLLPMFGQYSDSLFLAYDDPVQQDRSMQSTIDASDVSAGIRTRNEIRSDRGLPPVEGGDELLVPSGSMPIDVAIDQARNPSPIFGTLAQTTDNEQDSGRPIGGESTNLGDAEHAPEPNIELRTCPDGWHYMPADDLHDSPYCMRGDRHPETADSVDDCVCKSKSAEVSQKSLFDSARSLAGIKRAPVDRRNAEYESMLFANEDSISIFESNISDTVRRVLQRLADTGLSVETMFSTEAKQEIEKATGEYVRAVTIQGGEQALTELGVELDFNFLDPSIDSFLREYTSELSASILDGTKRDVESRINRGIRDGLSTDDIADSILELTQTGKDGVPLENRARMIARTEVASIHEGARLQAWTQSGLVKAKRWLVSAGACPFCRELGRMRPDPIPLSEPFVSGGKQISAGGRTLTTYKAINTAPLHPNCRCGTVEVVEDEDVKIDERKL